MIVGLFTLQCGGTVLADGSAAGGICESIKINGQRVLQVEDIIRATNKAVFGRGNAIDQISLKVSVQYGTLTAAIDAFMQANTLPTQASFILSFQESSTVATWTISGAGWSAVNRTLGGNTVVYEYQVEGGPVVSGNVPASGTIDGGNGFATAQSDQIDGGNLADNMSQSVTATIDGGSF